MRLCVHLLARELDDACLCDEKGNEAKVSDSIIISGINTYPIISPTQ